MKEKAKKLLTVLLGCILLIGNADPVSAAGTLTIAVSSGTVAAGDTMTVTVYAVNNNNEEVTSDMNITYDSSKLEYVSSSASGASGGGGTVKATGSSVDIKFKAIASGDAYVKAEGATLTAAGAHINVSGTAASATDTDGQQDADNAAKSGDNSLSSLSISPGTLSPEFKSGTTQYTAQVSGDVSEVKVTPVLSNSKATVESVTGNTGLKEGQNTITILVKAENGTEASYKIVVTKAAGTTQDEQNGQDQADSQETVTTDAAVAGDGSITVNGESYQISDNFSDADIPDGFVRADFEYKGAAHKGISFENGHLGMYYLTNAAGEGKFFVYDADRDGFYPFVRMTNGEHFIILMVVPNGAIPPDNYRETSLTLPDATVVSAYQYEAKDAEIVNTVSETTTDTESTQSTETAAVTQVSANGSAFYIFYAMDDTGVAGWYQYDAQQNTYQRLNGETIADSSDAENYNTLLDSYNSMSDRFKKTRTNDRRLIAVLIFVSVVLLILIINLILKLRDDLYPEEEEEEEEAIPVKRRKKARTAGKTERPVREHRPKEKEKKKEPERERVRRKVRQPIETEEDTDSFYAGDDASIMDEFEDEPTILPKRDTARKRKVHQPELKQPTAKQPKQRHPVSQQPVGQPEAENEDDDLEFLDLND